MHIHMHSNTCATNMAYNNPAVSTLMLNVYVRGMCKHVYANT